jgi:hypothetical protein
MAKHATAQREGAEYKGKNDQSLFHIWVLSRAIKHKHRVIVQKIVQEALKSMP